MNVDRVQKSAVVETKEENKDVDYDLVMRLE